MARRAAIPRRLILRQSINSDASVIGDVRDDILKKAASGNLLFIILIVFTGHICPLSCAAGVMSCRYTPRLDPRRKIWMRTSYRAALVILGIGAAFVGGLALAQPSGGQSQLERLRKLIVDEHPETRVLRVDRDRLIVRRLDVVDEKGTIRLSLSAPTPEPIVDGIQYKRKFPTSGMLIFDANGTEQGGVVTGPTGVGFSADHQNRDAVGWKVMPDGSVMFVMNDRGEVIREPALNNRVVPLGAYATRIKMTVAADGTPAIALADSRDRPRLRFTVTPAGHGAIEFLDAQGRVVQTLAPELAAAAAK